MVPTTPSGTIASVGTTTAVGGSTTVTQEGSLLPVILGAVIGVVLLACLVVVVAIVCYKRRQALSPYTAMSDHPDTEYNFMVTDTVSNDLSTPTILKDLPVQAPLPSSSLPTKFII